MKKLILLIIFILGAGIAFFFTSHFISETSRLDHQVSSNLRYCNLSCCLPEDIRLSPSQKEQIQTLERNYCQCRDTLSVQIDQKRLTLADLLLQPKPDQSAIDTLLRDIAKLQTELEKKTVLHILEVKNQLAPEQQDQFIKPIVHEIRRRCRHRELLENAP